MSQIGLSLPPTKPRRPVVSPTSSCKPSRDLLMAWLLFLLSRQASYGYELHRELETHGMTIDLAAMYRTLRKLEHQESAASSWAESVVGPRRRLYELTTKGRRELDALVQTLTATRDVHAAFLRAHDRSTDSALCA
jgi:PadR family transcriptional regulator, regulatory protein PadR